MEKVTIDKEALDFINQKSKDDDEQIEILQAENKELKIEADKTPMEKKREAYASLMNNKNNQVKQMGSDLLASFQNR